MEQEPRYLFDISFPDSEAFAYYRDLIDQPFGYYIWKNRPIYNTIVLAVVTNSNLSIIEQVHDEDNPSVYKEIKVTIEGSTYWESYVEGFKLGINEFKERPVIPYGNGSDEFLQDLHQLLIHGDNSNLSWFREAKANGLFVSKSIFYRYGIYAGLCYGVDQLVDKYPSIRDAIYNCSDDANDTSNLPIAKEQAILQQRSQEETAQIVLDILRPLSGLSPQGRKIMNSDDFNRLIRYTEYLVLNDSLPENIEVIEHTTVSVGHIRYTFYRLHQRLFTTRSIRPSFIDFLHAVFKQFNTYEKSTTRKQFSTYPSAYFTDFNISS